MVLEQIISYFKELSAIPRQSTDEKAASDYLVNFAKELGLWVKQDEDYNVLIKKPASKGMEDRKPVIIQGHIDMVYVVEEGKEHRYEDGIKVLDDGEFLYADGTTLGADNGIAIAYAMMLMADKETPLPPLEFVFTIQEEIGLLGAKNVDLSEFEGKALINLDSEEEGIFCIGCAGGIRSLISLPAVREEVKGDYIPLEVTVGGLKGGHSGGDIHLERGSAIVLLGRILHALVGEQVKIGKVAAPGKSNAISGLARAVIYVKEEACEAVTAKLGEMEAVFRNEFAVSDTVNVKIKRGEAVSSCEVFTKETEKKLLGLILLLPQGVAHMSMAVEGLVQTSMNTGSMEEKDGKIEFYSALRSSVESQKYELRDKVQLLADTLGVSCEWAGDYPGWQYKEESRIRDLAVEKFRELYQKEAKVEAIHAGLECGYWAAKIDDADILSMGPDMFDVHSPKERVSKQSIARTWELLTAVLAAY